MRANLRQIAEAAAYDVKKAHLDAIGDFTHIDVFHHQVLVATYVPPARVWKGPNGEDVKFYESDKKLDEHRFQGKVALVLKVGPTAFQDDGVNKFGGKTVTPGDWVFFRTSDGWEFFLGEAQASSGASVRLVEDTCIKGRVSDPSMIY